MNGASASPPLSESYFDSVVAFLVFIESCLGFVSRNAASWIWPTAVDRDVK